ncbi:MAG TPA: APC family permease [Pseudonocardia sp.]|nr:APC family permease [Pseudonocardia sp.]
MAQEEPLTVRATETPPPTGAPPAGGSPTAGELRRGVLPSWAVFGVALGVLAPASTLALAIGVVLEIAGPLSWLTWAVTSALVVGFAGAIAWLARRFTTTGGIYVLATRAVGRTGGFFVMTAHLCSSLVSGPACVLGTAIYLEAWLGKFGVPDNAATLAVLSAAVGALVIALSLREVKLSAKLLLVIEFCTVAVIVVLLVVVLVRAPGGMFDGRQFDFSGLKASAILATAGFSVFSLAGFDHSATLGREAANPRRAVSVAVLGSVLGCGVLYILATYVIVLGFRDLPMTQLDAPLDLLAAHYGIGWIGYLIDPGVAISFFGSTLGILAGISRSVYTMARDGLLPRGLARVGTAHSTPSGAVWSVGGLFLVVGVLGALLARAETSYGLMGTFSGYMLIGSYGLTAVTAGVCAVRTRSVRTGIALCTLLAVVGSALVYWYSFHPFPTGAKAVVATLFFAVVLGLVALYCVLRLRRPAVLDLVGAADRDDVDDRGGEPAGERV